MTPRRPVLLLVVLVAACAAAISLPGAPTETMPVSAVAMVPLEACILVATNRETDSLHVWGYNGSCEDPRPDTMMTWRIPSQHERCDMVFTANGVTGELTIQWGRCLPPAKRGDDG